MFKNEARHAKEWVDHHRLEGVTDFLLLDNGSTDNSADILKDLGCRVIDYPERHSQEKAFNEYGSMPANWDNTATRHIHTDWIMIIDFDEYVYAKNGYVKITDYLKSLSPHIDGIRLQWKLFGSNGLVAEPNSVIQGFTSRAPEGKELEPPKRWNYKTIYRNKALGMPRKIYVHAPEPLGQVIYPVPYDSNEPSKSFVSGGRMECEKHVLFDESEKFLELNHYATGSLEDYMYVRSVKGDVNVAAWEDNFRDYQYFKKLDFADVYDDELYRKRSQNRNWEKYYPAIQPNIQNPEPAKLEKNKTIMCYWDGGFAKMPPTLQRIYFHNLNVCNKYGVNLLLIDDNNVDQYIDTCNIFSKLKPNHKSDYVRWKFLNKHGGCWIDCDIILLNDITRISTHDLTVFPELELTSEQYLAMEKHGADTREILDSKHNDLVHDDVDYCKVGCCILKGTINSPVLKWAERRLISTISKAHHKGNLDADGTISYDVMPWHVLGPLICAQSLNMFQSRCSIVGQGREDGLGFNVVTWKVDKSNPGYDTSNLPGYDKSQWYMNPSEARRVAKQVMNNPNSWAVPIWSIYRESDLDNPSDTVFNSDQSIYKYIIS